MLCWGTIISSVDLVIYEKLRMNKLGYTVLYMCRDGIVHKFRLNSLSIHHFDLCIITLLFSIWTTFFLLP